MKESNVIAGFETTGIWPLNKEKYVKSRFDIHLLKKVSEMGGVWKTRIRLGIIYQYYSRAFYSRFQKSW